MKIGVLGTGMVGKTIGNKLISLGYEVMMGSRTANNEKALEWASKAGDHAYCGTFAQASAFGEIIFNCTKGLVALDVLASANESDLNHKILIDISNPLDSSHGFPPVLSVSNTTSLGEQIQEKFPELKVVKTLNTMNCNIMVEPTLINGGEHVVFVCGNDENAKKTVQKLLNEFGWKDHNILDLGDISQARGTEMFLPLWIRIMRSLGTHMFQIQVVK